MRIQHNIPAMNAYRNLSNNQSSLSKNLEKLSSGYKINRAGDDAAGLAISEKMRAQITGLDAAQKNVKDGISLVQTAEGAMQEIHDMLGRMKYLATQSANGIFDNEVDRKNLQKEVNSLKSEIDRIADSANFNGQKLLDGTLAAKDVAASAAKPTELQDKNVVVTGGDPLAYHPAVGKHYTLDVSTTDFSTTNFDAFKFTYTNDKGEEKELILGETSVGQISGGTPSDMAKSFVDAIKNESLMLGVADVDGKTNLAEFKKLFDISADSKGKVTIIAKDPNSGAQLTKFEHSGDTKAETALAGTSATIMGNTVKAEDEYATVNLAASTASITLNGKKYEITGAADTKAAAQALVDQLRQDGFEVEIDKSVTNGQQLKFTNMDQLREAQKGVEILNPTNDKFDVNAKPATKGSIEFQFTAGATSDTFTLTYVNAEGKTVTKDIAFNGNADSTSAANALREALKKDEELNKLFDFGGTGNSVTITSKDKSTGAAHAVGVAAAKTGMSDIKTTAPTDKGKELVIESTAKSKNILAGDQITIDGKTYQFVLDKDDAVADGVVKVEIGKDNDENFKNLHKALSANGVEASLVKDTGTGKVIGLRFDDFATDVKEETVKEGGLNLQIGDTSDKYNQMNVSVNDMHAKALGIGDLDISNQEGANAAIDKIMNAINFVSSTRGDLGAIQNRLEHTHNNLGVMRENIQDAESAIRDTDVADEMMRYTKNNILVQSAQAMLAQANQLPQGVLQLLQ